MNPDAYFVPGTDDGSREHFFLEVDRGTEPITRTTWQRTFVYLQHPWLRITGKLVLSPPKERPASTPPS